MPFRVRQSQTLKANQVPTESESGDPSFDAYLKNALSGVGAGSKTMSSLGAPAKASARPRVAGVPRKGSMRIRATSGMDSDAL